MSMNQSNDPLRVDAARSIREHWLLFIIEGIVLVVLGLLAVLLPPLATLGVTIFLGWLFLISGIMGLIATFWARQAPGFWWSLLSAVLGIAVGLVLLVSPVSGAVSLTLVLSRVFCGRGRRLDHVRVGSPPAALGPLGLHAVQRADRSDPRRHDPGRASRDRGLGDWLAGRHQHDLRRLGAHCHGPARAQQLGQRGAHAAYAEPRRISAGCPRAVRWRRRTPDRPGRRPASSPRAGSSRGNLRG